MDPIAILSGIKDKVLDAHHFDLLKKAYEVQNQNIEQLKTNNEALRENNSLLKEKAAKQEKEITLLKGTVEELKSRISELPQAGRLTQDEESILKFLSTHAGRERAYDPRSPNSYRAGPTAQEIASHLGLTLSELSHSS